MDRSRVGGDKSRGRDPLSLGAAAVALVAFAVPASVWRPLTTHQPWIELAGVAVLLPATAGAVWSRLVLGSMWSSAPRLKTEHQLRTTGPYAITRHPIYTALIAMLIGSALTQGLGRSAVIALAAALFLRSKIGAEERLLEREFPQQYASYRARVPQLVPRVWPRLGGGHQRS
jgi:protein-S-isoprenylcysteine O-methyltransferase Ste14